MPDVIRRQREVRRKIIREWTKSPAEKRRSIEEISAFAKTASERYRISFVQSRRDPYEKVMSWLVPRAHLPARPPRSS